MVSNIMIVFHSSLVLITEYDWS